MDRNRARRALDYPRLADDKVVIWWSNGINWPEAARQLRYLSQTKRDVMKNFALTTPAYEDAASFDSVADASRFLAEHEALRGRPYHEIQISTVAEMKVRCGYEDPAPEPEIAADTSSGPSFDAGSADAETDSGPSF